MDHGAATTAKSLVPHGRPRAGGFVSPKIWDMAMPFVVVGWIKRTHRPGTEGATCGPAIQP